MFCGREAGNQRSTMPGRCLPKATADVAAVIVHERSLAALSIARCALDMSRTDVAAGQLLVEVLGGIHGRWGTHQRRGWREAGERLAIGEAMRDTFFRFERLL